MVQGGAFGTEGASMANFDHNFKANTRAPFEMMTHAIPHLIGKIATHLFTNCLLHTSEAGKASGPVMSIVAVSSVNGLQSFAGLGAYCGSKAAIDHIARVGVHDI